MELDIEQSLYIGALTQGAGVRVTLHEQGVMPFPYEDGFSVAPGMATSVGLRKVSQLLTQIEIQGTCIKKLDNFQMCMHLIEISETAVKIHLSSDLLITSPSAKGLFSATLLKMACAQKWKVQNEI